MKIQFCPLFPDMGSGQISAIGLCCLHKVARGLTQDDDPTGRHLRMTMVHPAKGS